MKGGWEERKHKDKDRRSGQKMGGGRWRWGGGEGKKRAEEDEVVTEDRGRRVVGGGPGMDQKSRRHAHHQDRARRDRRVMKAGEIVCELGPFFVSVQGTSGTPSKIRGSGQSWVDPGPSMLGSNEISLREYRGRNLHPGCSLNQTISPLARSSRRAADRNFAWSQGTVQEGLSRRSANRADELAKQRAISRYV